ncbi:MAG: ATP-binding protein [Planctomycetes bacterium]|nr:ATP-binding protein [Planctomycetota bacterium]
MASRNWALIQSGEVFESLVTTLLYFEDPKAALFGRRGKDGGQDARSGDGQTVYQAKHHEKPTPTKAIADAKAEAKKISRLRMPKHPYSGIWGRVCNWRLVTNTNFNANDKQRWDDEVVPLFKALGIEADYWGCAHLDVLLVKHPHVNQAYFQGESRAFLSIPEARVLAARSEPAAAYVLSKEFVGRANAMNEIRAFLGSDTDFLCIHGAGGIGKTRMLLEAGSAISERGHYQVLWANVATMARHSAWFDAIAPEMPTVVLIDEPDTPDVLAILAEQIGPRGRAGKWKVIVAARSAKDPVLTLLRQPKTQPRVRELALERLAPTDAELMCRNLISESGLREKPESWRTKAAGVVAKQFAGHPVWMALAVRSLEKHGDLDRVPESSEALAREYIDEAVAPYSGQERAQTQKLLRWVAAIGTVNRQDAPLVARLAQECGMDGPAKVLEALGRLVSRRILVQRGHEGRLCELKPDVLRDRALIDWFTKDAGFGPQPVIPSDDATRTVDAITRALLDGSFESHERFILEALGRVEFVLMRIGRPVGLFRRLFAGVLEAVGTLDAYARVGIIDALNPVAPFEPAQSVSLSSKIRAAVVADDTRFGVKFTHADVCAKLPEFISNAAYGARTEVEQRSILAELLELAAMEFSARTGQTESYASSGQGAVGRIQQVVSGSPGFHADYSDVAAKLCIDGLDRLAGGTASSSETHSLTALIGAVVQIERNNVSFSDHTFTHQSYFVGPDSPAWVARCTVVERLRVLLLEDGMDSDRCVTLWKLLASAHGSVNRAHMRVTGEFGTQLLTELRKDLQLASAAMQRRTMPLAELKSAKPIWEWHAQFDKDNDLKSESERLDAVYRQHDLVREFEPMTDSSNYKEHERLVEAKANELAQSSDVRAIQSFLIRAATYFGSGKGLPQLGGIAHALGRLATNSGTVREFVASGLCGDDGLAKDFAIAAAAAWICHEIDSSSPAKGLLLLGSLVQGHGSEQTEIDLIGRCFGWIEPLGGEVFAFLVSRQEMFLRHDYGPQLVRLMALAQPHDWHTVGKSIDALLTEVPSSQQLEALRHLMEASSWVVRKSDAGVPKAFGAWLLGHVLRVPDLDGLSGNSLWELWECLKPAEKADVSWFVEQLMWRHAKEVELGYSAFKATIPRTMTSQSVQPIFVHNAVDPTVLKSIASLVSLAVSTSSLYSQLPEILHDVDPLGLAVPTVVCDAFDASPDPQPAFVIARLARTYALNSGPWRAIARTVLRRANVSEPDVRLDFYAALCGHDSGVYSRSFGTVAERYIDQAEQAKTYRKGELDQTFIPIWDWLVEVRDGQLQRETGQAQEERGE